MEKTTENIDNGKITSEESLPITKKKIFRSVKKIEKVKFLNIVHNLTSTDEQYLYWNEPAFGFSFIAIGKCISIKSNGPDRIEETEKLISFLKDSIVSNEDEFNLTSLPLFLGGLKFAPNGNSELWKDFNDSEWFIPKTILLKYDKEYYQVTSVYSDDESELSTAEISFEQLNSLAANGYPEFKSAKIVDSNIDDNYEFEFWKDMINSALESIDNKQIHKVVLSREVQLLLDREPDIDILLKQLADRYPYCYIFAFRKNGSIFFGASPERLAKFSGGTVEADALAGSFPRGRTLEEDIQLEKELLSNEKNLNEQKAVVDFIKSSFSKFSVDITYPEEPIIRKLPNIQHLWTPIKAKINSDKPILSFLKEVHPTPAICGAPWSTAMSTILNKEKHSRGLFTGAIGWFNLKNEGEFAVAIRSALLKGKNVYAFAGCGIVQGSDPNTEFEETKLKLRPILNLFDYEEKDKS